MAAEDRDELDVWKELEKEWVLEQRVEAMEENAWSGDRISKRGVIIILAAIWWVICRANT